MRPSDAQKADLSALISHLDRLTKAVEALATKLAPVPDFRPVLASFDAHQERNRLHAAYAMGLVCVIGIAAILSPFAARRDPPPAPVIDSAAIAREVAAGLAPTIATIEKKQDDRTKILEGAILEFVDKVPKAIHQPAPTNSAPH